MKKRHFVLALIFAPAVAIGTYACVEPPPKIDAIPPSGLSLRLKIFGASAQDSEHSFEAVKQNNKNFSIVQDGGDGEVLIGLDNDSPACVPPTALCSYKVSYRVRDNAGNIVASDTTSVTATSDHCNGLCAKALTNVSVKIVEAASSALKSGGSAAGDLDGGSAVAIASSDVADAAPEVATPPVHSKKSKDKTKIEAPPAKAEPAICAVGHGNHLPSDEAERRAAQVEVLKRLNVLSQDEYDCLRKAYLERL
ncbi:MAG: hypothetical protein ABI183_04880 [Polyangiaceae bacterium]